MTKVTGKFGEEFEVTITSSVSASHRDIGTSMWVKSSVSQRKEPPVVAKARVIGASE